MITLKLLGEHIRDFFHILLILAAMTLIPISYAGMCALYFYLGSELFQAYVNQLIQK